MQTNNIKIITYFTKDTPYELEARKLTDSLDNLGITNYEAVGVVDRGNWQMNVQWRPYIIHRELMASDMDLLVVDADATFESIPDWDWLSNLDCDIAAHVMDKGFWKQDTSQRNYSLMAGTLFVKNTQAAKELMTQWNIECKKSQGSIWDMRILEKLMRFDFWGGEFSGDYKFKNLPVSYCDIDKTMNNVENSIIKHHQASRRLRNENKTIKKPKKIIETFLITRFNLGLDLQPQAYDAWMKKRLTLFKELTFPSICRQSNQDFRWLILIDPDTPMKWVKKLKDDAYELIYFEGMPFEHGMKKQTADIINRLKNPKAAKVITCRCDNDDTLHFKYIEYVRSGLSNKAHCTGIYFVNGMQRWIDDHGNSIFYECQYVRNMFPAVIEDANDVKTVFCEQHTDLSKRFRMSKSRICKMWIWNHHEDNFSNMQRTVKPRGVERTQTESYITENFGVNTMAKTLNDLALLYKTDKSSKGHDYCSVYERFLKPKRNERLKLLEIGVFKGGSLRMWQAFFPHGTVQGADFDPKTKTHTKIPVAIGNQGDVDFLKKLGEMGPWDVIIDDGSHRWDHQLLFYETMWKYLKPGGLMSIEDMHTSYMKHKQRPNTEQPAEFFTVLAKELTKLRPTCKPKEMHFSKTLLLMVK